MQDKYLDAVVVARRPLTERIAEFLIAPQQAGPLPIAEAGSHLELRFGGQDGRFLRHYSVVGPLDLSDKAEPFYRIAVQREPRSRGSDVIHRSFAPGTGLRISRPINSFRLARGLPHTLLVAGGIGVTPILAMARSLRYRHERFSAFYAGARHAAMAYADTLAALCGGALRLHEAESQGVPDMVALLAAQPVDTHVYVCGPPPMIEAVIAAGAALGWAPGRIRFELFNAAHRPEDQPFEVRLPTGQSVPVGAGTTILDALEAAGVDTYADCRRGECGLCLTEVLDCDGTLDHRDRFLGADDPARARQMTICCSRIQGKVLALNI
jgi:ferredoxin-NADP reductase